MHDIRLNYDDLLADLTRRMKEEKKLIEYLLKVPEGFQSLAIRDLERIVDNENITIRN